MNSGITVSRICVGGCIYAARNRHEPEEPDEKHGKGQRPYAAQ